MLNWPSNAFCIALLRCTLSCLMLLRSAVHDLVSFTVLVVVRCLPRAVWTPVVCGRHGEWHLLSLVTFQVQERSLPAA